jgi:hypothetical protein
MMRLLLLALLLSAPLCSAQSPPEGTSYMVLAGQPERKVTSPMTPEEQAQFKKVYAATLQANSDLDAEGDTISAQENSYRTELKAAMVKADPAVAQLVNASSRSQLTQAQSDQVKQAQSDAMQANPNLQTEWDDLSKKMSDHQQKVDAAMIKLDPTVAPILAKLSP